MENELQTFEPTDLYTSVIGILQDESLKEIMATNPTLLEELDKTIMADVDIAPIMRNSEGKLFMQLAGEYYPLTLGKWIQEEKDPLDDELDVDMEYNCMMEIKGIHFLFVLEPIKHPAHVHLSLDDYEDDEEFIGQQMELITDRNITFDFIKVQRMLKGQLEEKELEQLLDNIKNNHNEELLNFSYFNGLPKDKRIDYDIVFYIFTILAIGEKVGLSKLPDEVPNGDSVTKVSYNYFIISLARKILFGIADENKMLASGMTEVYPSIGYFGYYNSIDPSIVLCPKRIDAAVETLQNKEGVLKGLSNKEEARKVLYAIVIIYLLAQAILDSTNQLSSDSKSGYPYPSGQLCKKEENGKQLYEKIEPESYLLMEKSLANMLTLNYFDEYSKRFKKCDFNEVREFFSIQLDAYKFGLVQYDYLKPDWRLWRACKKNLKIFCEK